MASTASRRSIKWRLKSEQQIPTWMFGWRQSSEFLLPDYQSVHVEADLRETKKRLGTHAQLPKLNSCYKFPAALFTRLRLLRRAARFKRRMVNLTLKPSPNPILAQKGKRLKVGCRSKAIFFPER